MNYKNALLQSRDIAAKIRAGEYKPASAQVEEDPRTSGLVPRPSRAKEQQSVGSNQGGSTETMQDMIAMYLANIRRQETGKPDTPEFKTESGEQRPYSRSDAGFEPVPGTLDDLAAAREAIAAVESRGSGDYSAVGPVVEKGMYKGQRAYGRYQVMEGNIAPWTKEVFGKSMSKEEFMNDPKAQDAVVEHQLKKSYNKFGSFDDSASVWFSGQPYNKAKGRSDGYTSVPEYVKKFRKHFSTYKRNENS